MAQKTENMQMKVVAEAKFPMLSFSPLATSSPRLTKMKKLRCDQSWNSSDGTDSSGNVTAQLVADVNVSHIKKGNDTTSSLHTALEFVMPNAFRNEIWTIVTREQLKSAIFKQKMIGDDKVDEKSAEFYATVTAERILFSQCRTWAGTIPVKEGDLEQYARYACEDWYMKKTVRFCGEELEQIIRAQCSFWTHVAPYFHRKGISMMVLKRIIERNLVRRTSGPRLSLSEVLQLLFALNGSDERQTFEYWFRILDVRASGILSFDDLSEFYGDIEDMLIDDGVAALSFDDVTVQYCDILKTSEWTLKAFKKNPQLAGRVFNGFVNAHRFLEEETDERMNTERVDDENFGEGKRTRWQRMLDHKYDNFYCPDTSSEMNSTFVKLI